MTTTHESTTIAVNNPDRVRRHTARRFLGRHGLLIAGVLTVAVAAVAVSQNWIATANLLPLLFTLPCVLMMLRCMSHGQRTENVPSPAPSEIPPARD
ncbi:MAG: hypothetical protein ACKVP3_12945 [Hyphomicrobiaceae bacterium]